MKNNSPFFCPIKQIRKSAWSTPEYLSDSDWALARAVGGAKSVQEFHNLVFATDANSEAFFWRIAGWPEGLHYMRSLAFAEGVWPHFSTNEMQMVRASCDGLLVVPSDAWITYRTSMGLHLRFKAPVDEGSFPKACQVAIDLAKQACPTELAAAVCFNAQGIGVQVVETDSVDVQQVLWARRLQAQGDDEVPEEAGQPDPSP